MRTAFCMIAATVTMVCGGSLPDRSSWPRRRFTGVAIFRMEYAEFIAGGTCDPASFDYATAPKEVWIGATDPEVVPAFRDVGVLQRPYGAALVTMEGRLSPVGRAKLGTARATRA
jgi:hypothetical protein